MSGVKRLDGKPMTHGERVMFYKVVMKVTDEQARILAAADEGEPQGDTYIRDEDGTIRLDVGEPMSK